MVDSVEDILGIVPLGFYKLESGHLIGDAVGWNDERTCSDVFDGRRKIYEEQRIALTERHCCEN